MDSPKISVLIPMYNRKHYIEQCLNSVLTQRFQDFEIIVRDDGSNDGSADFVQERYAAQISSGKIKLRRNPKNIGEFATDNRLLREATGKYVMILHSDDLYLPHALEHLCAVAEHFRADVVHCCHFFKSPKDGVIKDGASLSVTCAENRPVNKIVLVPDDPFLRFDEWDKGGTFIDAQHNIFRREFIMDNDLFFTHGGNRTFALCWIMKAKIFIKTPVPSYVYRDSPDSVTRSKFPPKRVEGFVAWLMKLSRWLDEFFAGNAFFRNNEEVKYRVRSHLFTAYDNHWLGRNEVYKDGISPELNRAVENAFKKYFGDDATYPTFLFHWIHTAMYRRPFNRLTPPHTQR